MSRTSVFVELSNLLWDIEEFTLWVPTELGSLAYLIDRLYKTDEYEKDIKIIIQLAKEKNFNELAVFLSRKIVLSASDDPAICDDYVLHLKEKLTMQEAEYERNCLADFGLIGKKEYFPDWFFEILPEVLKLKRLQYENAIIGYCKDQKLTFEESEKVYLKFSSNIFLLQEFYCFVKGGDFKNFRPITVKGISAKQIHKELDLSALDAYLYLFYLQEEPEKALQEYHVRLQNK